MSVNLAVLNDNGKKGDPVTASKLVFDVPYNESLIHEVITGLLSNSRSDTSMQKNRSDVSGGGCKPWRQKGLGRARAGSIRSPLWRGGGKTFGSQQTLHNKKINKKAYRTAVRSILSELVRQDRLFVVDSLAMNEVKTKQLKDKLNKMNLSNVLILLEAFDEPLYLSSRNIPYVDIMMVDELYPVSLVAYDHLIITKAALKQIEEWLS